jgi:uncharacterized protein
MTREPVSTRFLDVFELARTQAAVHGRLPLAAMPRLVASLAGSSGDLEYTLQGEVGDRGRPAARLRIRGTVDLVCDRCGHAVPFELAGDSSYYFVRSEQELGRIPVDDSPDEPLLGSTRFDLHELIEDEAILALPISPRHAACQPAAEVPAATVEGNPERPRPFAALAQLKSRRQ